MAGWIDLDNRVLSSVTALARELADPIRLSALQLLAAEGPHTMSQLADALGVSAPRLGNHLARLRTAGHGRRRRPRAYRDGRRTRRAAEAAARFQGGRVSVWKLTLRS